MPQFGASGTEGLIAVSFLNPCVPTSRNTLRSHYAQIWAFSDFESNLQAIGCIYEHGGYTNKSGSGFYVRAFKGFNFKC